MGELRFESIGPNQAGSEEMASLSLRTNQMPESTDRHGPPEKDSPSAQSTLDMDQVKKFVNDNTLTSGARDRHESYDGVREGHDGATDIED